MVIKQLRHHRAVDVGIQGALHDHVQPVVESVPSRQIQIADRRVAGTLMAGEAWGGRCTRTPKTRRSPSVASPRAGGDRYTGRRREAGSICNMITPSPPSGRPRPCQRPRRCLRRAASGSDRRPQRFVELLSTCLGKQSERECAAWSTASSSTRRPRTGWPGSGPTSRRRRGVAISAGTDTFGTATDPLGKEVRLLVEAGIPALAALQAATTGTARLLNWHHRVGRLVPGYLADLTVVDANPLDTPRPWSTCDSSSPKVRSNATTCEFVLLRWSGEGSGDLALPRQVHAGGADRGG